MVQNLLLTPARPRLRLDQRNNRLGELNSPLISGTHPEASIAKLLATDVGDLGAGVADRVAAPIPGLEAPSEPEPHGLPADKWLLSSATQKLIRRGRAEQAVRAALALHGLAPDYLPRRLPIIAFEDIGIGDPTVCFDVLHFFGSQRFRAAMQDKDRRDLLANLVYRLAASVKSRSGCDIVCLANADTEYSKSAARSARSSETCLVAMAADRGAALTSRALALHLLTGMSVQEGRWHRTLSRFNEKALSVVADRLELPEILGWLMIEGRHTAGLAAMLPLVLEAAQSDELRIEQASLFEGKPILGLPQYAADMHTRAGKGAIAQFAMMLRTRHPRFFEAIPDTRTLPKLVGMAIFHAEGSKLDRWLENKTLASYREQIERVELQVLGLTEPELHRTLYRILDEERPLLRRIRQSHLQAAFGGTSA